jgi:hypothetical protein
VRQYSFANLIDGFKAFVAMHTEAELCSMDLNTVDCATGPPRSHIGRCP